MSAAIEVESLEVRFGPVRAVAGVSFAVAKGETLGVVGESGSGKTTVARVIAGLQRPTAGRVRVDGRLGMVFQDPLGSLNPRLTAREAVETVPRGFRRPDGAALLAEVGLGSEALDKYPHEFSGGQRQRVCIARAIALRPKLLICDEAVSALDLSIRAQVLKLLADLKRRLDLSILFITHDLGVVQHIADRIVVMHGGKIVEQGACEDVLKRPRAEYTRYLMAAVPKIGKPFRLLQTDAGSEKGTVLSQMENEA